MSGQDLVTLNVGGKIFTTRLSTLKQFPASRLAGMLDGRDQEFKTVDGQVFVDRDGALFSFILDFLRNHELLLPSDFSDHHRLQREALFYGLDSLVDLVSQFLLQSKSAIVEVHFLNQNTQAFFRVFGSCSKTIEMLSRRITMFVERPTALTRNSDSPLVLPPQRPSHHDLLFHCGSDGTAENHAGVRYISIKPDNRKLANGTNVLGLLVDTLLKEGFHLVSTGTPTSGETSECYVFQRIKSPQVLGLSKTPNSETTTMPAPSQK